jgi:FlaA1/EpsC-like NDP-sugar epimerase
MMSLRSSRPDVVFHAAAYKHVPLMESRKCMGSGEKQRAGHAERGARGGWSSGTGEFVLISTDKAVNPTNVMGASKRFAEVVCQAVQAGRMTTRFVMVRFGNVLGSSGSVIPRFREQIAKRRAGDGDASGDHPLLHADSRSGATGAAGRADGCK